MNKYIVQVQNSNDGVVLKEVEACSHYAAKKLAKRLCEHYGESHQVFMYEVMENRRE